MHWKLFFTIVAGIVASYFVIRWLQTEESLPDQAENAEERTIGFHATMNQHTEKASC